MGHNYNEQMSLNGCELKTWIYISFAKLEEKEEKKYLLITSSGKFDSTKIELVLGHIFV